MGGGGGAAVGEGGSGAAVGEGGGGAAVGEGGGGAAVVVGGGGAAVGGGGGGAAVVGGTVGAAVEGGGVGRRVVVGLPAVVARTLQSTTSTLPYAQEREKIILKNSENQILDTNPHRYRYRQIISMQS